MSSGWLSWGSDPFAELVEKATSELLPPNHEDVALNLEICDQIRAKQVQSKHAADTLKKRLNHSNPNVVLLTLGLTDICIKNSGDHFLAEVSSPSFMDNLVSILNAPSGPGKNVDVRNKLLRLIQSWAQVADARPAQGPMSYVSKTYADLKKRGYTFPPPDPSHVVSAAMVETMTAPEWADGDVCLRCRQPFTTFTRKHHCRNCGNVFCHSCSSHTMALPWFGVGQDVRVCDGCYANRGPPSNARRAKVAPPPAPKTDSSLSRSATVGASSSAVKSFGRGGAGNAYQAPQRSNTVTASSSSSRRKREEHDIALAIKLSLEASSQPSGGYVPSTPAASAAPTREVARGPSGRMGEGTDAVGEDDADLAAAIAASLRDYAAPQPSAPSGFSDVGSVMSVPVTPAPQSERSAYDGGSYISGSSYAGAHSHQPAPAPAPQAQPSLPIPPSIELPSQDIDSLLSFSQTVLRAEEAASQSQGHPYTVQQLHQTISDSRTQGMYERAQAARPKMARSLDEAGRRHSVLIGMHEKLTEAVRLYNRLLDAQMGRGPQIVYAGAGAHANAIASTPQRYAAEPSQGYGQPSTQPTATATGSNGIYPSLPATSAPNFQATSPQAQHHVVAQQNGYAPAYPSQFAGGPPGHVSGYPGLAHSTTASYNGSPAPTQAYAHGQGAGPSAPNSTYGAPQTQAPVVANAPAASAPPPPSTSFSVPDPQVESATASLAALSSAPSAPTWTPASAAAFQALPTSPSAQPVSGGAQPYSQYTYGSSATSTFVAASDPSANGPASLMGMCAPPSNAAPLAGGPGGAQAPTAPLAATQQEPWKREDERPLIDL